MGFADWDDSVNRYVEWHPYTNKRTNKSGWISEGGKVRYDNPHEAEQKKTESRATANTALAQAINDPSKMTAGHVEALHEHMKTLPRDRLRELTRQVGAKVGGLKQHLAERLLAHVEGRPQPKFDYGRKPRSESLVATVARFGGINPNDHAFKTVYGNMHEAIEDGIALGVFRKSGGGADSLAQELHAAGHIQIPDGVHPQEYLLSQLKEGVKSLHAQTQHDFEDAEELYYKALQEAEEYAKQSAPNRSKVKDALRGGEEAGRTQGKTWKVSDSGQGIQRGRKAAYTPSNDPIPF